MKHPLTIIRMDGKDVSRMWNSLLTVNQNTPQSANQNRAQPTYHNRANFCDASCAPEQGTFTLIVPWFGGHVKPSVPCTCILQACTLQNVTGYSKRARDHPGSFDCTSKLHSSTLGPEEKYSLSVRSAEILRHMSSALIREDEEELSQPIRTEFS